MAVLWLDVSPFDAAESFRRPQETQVEVSVIYDNSVGHALRISLTNRSATPLTINEAFLPWGSTYAMILTAVEMTDPVGPGPVLERTRALENPYGSRITIKPGESREGKADLVWQFPKLTESLLRNDVIVFWSYAGGMSEGQAVARTGGFVVVPASRKGK
jgi:hypothetical protein